MDSARDALWWLCGHDRRATPRPTLPTPWAQFIGKSGTVLAFWLCAVPLTLRYRCRW